MMKESGLAVRGLARPLSTMQVRGLQAALRASTALSVSAVMRLAVAATAGGVEASGTESAGGERWRRALAVAVAAALAATPAAAAALVTHLTLPRCIKTLCLVVQVMVAAAAGSLAARSAWLAQADMFLGLSRIRPRPEGAWGSTRGWVG